MVKILGFTICDIVLCPDYSVVINHMGYINMYLYAYSKEHVGKRIKIELGLVQLIVTYVNILVLTS